MPRYSHVQQISEQTMKPNWLRVKAATGKNPERIRTILRAHKLHTVCEEAHCPNVGECWGGGTATFMLMGDTCTRGCRFCMVKSGNPNGELDIFEPVKIARVIAELGLKYVVITSVDRDDLPDGGAEHFASTVKAIKRHDPNVITEVLIPDFRGDKGCIRKIVDAGSEVIAHNVETTATLTPKVRDPRASYQQSLKVLKTIKELDQRVQSKTSIMLGLGETEEDLIKTMRDLREVDVNILTLGQYLRPSNGHIPVVEFIPESQFEYYKQIAEKMGFLYVASGPLVRSSYKAAEFFVEALIRRRRTDLDPKTLLIESD
jgi:lipoic acid synthetase